MHNDFIKLKKGVALLTIHGCFLWVNKGSFYLLKTNYSVSFTPSKDGANNEDIDYKDAYHEQVSINEKVVLKQ